MKKITYFSLLALGLSFSACQDFVKDLDVNPNNPATVSASNILQGIILADVLSHEGDGARTTGMWTGQFTGVDRQYISTNSYDVTAGNFDDLWSTLYYGVITQARLAGAQAVAGSNRKLQGVTQVLEAHAAGTTTALFGDIPFREAGNREEFPNPSYDPQAQVYSDLQAELDDAIANLGAAGIIPMDKDILFKGKFAKWQRVAQTLKARYYLQTKDYANALKAAGQGIDSVSNSMAAPHVASAGGRNVYWQFLVNERPGYLSATNSYAARLLDPAQKGVTAANHNNAKTDEAARFKYYYTASATAGYGLQEGAGFSDIAQSFPLVTYSENQLILAEANARLGNKETALAALNRHRAALATRFTSKYDAYELGDLPGTGTDDQKLLNEILLERYLTFIGQIEAFNDARRTNNALGLPIKRQTATRLPQRFLYSQSEVNSNSNAPSPIPDLFAPTPVNQ